MCPQFTALVIVCRRAYTFCGSALGAVCVFKS